jgi:hypothetical protein
VFLIRGHSMWRHKLSWTLASFQISLQIFRIAPSIGP